MSGLVSSWDSNFKMGIQDSFFIKGGIQDSSLNPRKMAGIQDSNLVFKGPICVWETHFETIHTDISSTSPPLHALQSLWHLHSPHDVSPHIFIANFENCGVTSFSTDKS